MTAGLDADGMPIAWKIRTAGQSIIAAVSPRVMRFGVDRNFLQGLLEDMPYDVPNYLVDFAMRNTHVPVGVWRSVNHSQNAFFKESFIDEMAHAAGDRPLSVTGAGCWQHERRRISRCSTPPPTRAGWGTACAAGRRFAASRSTSRKAASAPRWSRSRSTRTARCGCTAWSSAIDAGHVVNPLTRRDADRKRHRLRPHRRALRRDHHQATGRSSSRTSTTIRCCAWPRCRGSRP